MRDCQELARLAWHPDPAFRPRLIGAELWVGDWRCAGARRPWTREVTHHAAIELQREGTHLRRLGRTHHVVDPTSIAVLPAADEHRMASPTPHPQRVTIVMLRGALLDELGAREPAVQRLSPSGALLHRRVIRARDPVALEEAALALAQHVGAAAPPPLPGTRASWQRVADDVRHVIATRFRERLTLAQLARSAGVSAFHLSRVFRAATGETVHRHLRRVRLRVTLYELDSAGALARLAAAAGFSSHSHLTSAFRAEFGVVPSKLA